MTKNSRKTRCLLWAKKKTGKKRRCRKRAKK